MADFSPLARMADVGVVESGDATTDEIAAAAVGLVMPTDSADGNVAAAADTSTGTATDMGVTEEGEPRSPSPLSRMTEVLRGAEPSAIILTHPVCVWAGRPRRWRQERGPRADGWRA